MRKASRPAALLAAAALLALAGPAAAQGIDLSRGGPVDVTANDGIEWRQADQVVIARGNARAVRGGAAVDADRLLARYRPSRGRGEAAGAAPAAGASDSPLGGSSEIWRLEAEGNVRISTATDTARGDRAVYDIDQAVLVLTGRALSLNSAQQVITARDSLEYWSAKRMAVARGDALVVDRQEDRRIRADTLVAYFLEDAPGTANAPPRPPPVRPAAASAPGEREAPGAGRIDRVEAFGNVEIRTPTEVVRGDRGVYSPATGMARLLGNVRITRGDNQLNGREAIVNMRTGVARLVSSPGGRVQGLIQPNQDAGGGGGTAPGPSSGQPRR